MNLDGYRLVWEDEFLSDGPVDSSKWSCTITEHPANNEQQAYTDSSQNSYVKDGKLHLISLKQKCGIKDYTSARINTYGHQSWQYGYFEIRAKLPKGRGSWPAIWMLPDSIREGEHWPACGEIDIMEHIGRKEDSIWFSLHSQRHNHTRKDTKQYTTIVEYSNVCSEFHTYGIEWTKDYITFYVDGEAACTYRRSDDPEDMTETAWPFDKPYFLILNIAVGGGLGGEIDDEALPYHMEVDYVKVYQKD